MSKRLPKGFCANIKEQTVNNCTTRPQFDSIPFAFSQEVLNGKKQIIAKLPDRKK